MFYRQAHSHAPRGRIFRALFFFRSYSSVDRLNTGDSWANAVCIPERTILSFMHFMLSAILLHVNRFCFLALYCIFGLYILLLTCLPRLAKCRNPWRMVLCSFFSALPSVAGILALGYIGAFTETLALAIIVQKGTPAASPTSPIVRFSSQS